MARPRSRLGISGGPWRPPWGGPAVPEYVAFETDSFEYLEASPGLALIRLAGRWLADEECSLSDLELLVEREGTTLSVAPLPGGGSPPAVARAEGTPWRAGFSVPLDLVSDPA